MTTFLTIAAITGLPVAASFWSHRVADRTWGVR